MKFIGHTLKLILFYYVDVGGEQDLKNLLRAPGLFKMSYQVFLGFIVLAMQVR
jgi:hypothetical protein